MSVENRYPASTEPSKPPKPSMPNTENLYPLTVPATKDRPETTVFGVTALEAYAKAMNLPEPEMNRNAQWLLRRRAS